ncbi:hypothetical protein FRC03_009402 [Tulasnella sp. 419]|nr:hypothetical protein FRC03_009402 [Tulasnella sp. 419]
MALSEPTTLSGKARAWSFDLSVKGQTHYPFFTTLLPETSGSTPLNLLGLEGELVFTKPVFIRRLHLFDRVEVLSLSAFSQEKRTTHSKLGIIGLLYYLYTPTRAATETSQVEWAFPKLKRLQLRDMILPATTLELFIRVRCPINPIANAPSPLEVLSIVTCCLNGQNSDKTSVISTINLAGKRLGWEELVQRECNCPEMPPLNGVGCLNSSGEQLVFCSELM